jgi:putative aminopeptidase FrvX
MEKNNLQYLKDLTSAPSPSGYEMPIAAVMRARLEDSADAVETNVMGSVHGMLKGAGSGPNVMLAGHIDEIGLMVHYITDEGFVAFGAIGGIDAGILPGMRVNIWTAEGPLRGIIGKKAIHMMDPDERKAFVPIEKLCVDTGLSGEEAKRRIMIGDAITFALSLEEFGDGFATSRAFDDKIGAYVVTRVLEEVKRAGGATVDLTVAGTVQEEIGLRGGATSVFGIDPVVGIAVDCGHATDTPDADKRRFGEFRCGGGPLIARGPNVNPVVFARLVAAAEKAGVPYQISAEPRGTGTDANAIQLSRGGKAAGLVEVPVRYMHTPSEVTKLEDMDAAVKLLTQFVLDLDDTVDFTPRIGA